MTSLTEQANGSQTIASHARLIAAVLDNFPEGLEPPTHQDIAHYLPKPRLSWLLFNDGTNQKDRAAAIVKALGGKWDKVPSELFTFKSERGGVQLHVTVDRAQVCERIVTGTREVKKLVPAPDAPTVEITETIEDVEWRCEPLLSEVSS